MSQTARSDDSLLEERIEKIRKNNERIQRRYLEVEADKQNAAKSNALVQLSPPPEDEEPRFSHPRLPKKSERDIHEQDHENEINYSPRTSAREHNRFGPSTQPFTSTKSHSFSQDDGPPPDPVYNFLADRQRDPRANSRAAPFQRGGRGSRGMPPQYRDRERTGQPETRGKFSRGRGRGSDGPHQHAYEMWKSERHQIDQERINRQKTAGGEWRREWDKEKVSEDVDNDWPPSAGQGRIPYRRDKHTLESYVPREGGHPTGVNHPETNRDGKGITRKKKAHDPFATQDTRSTAKSPKPERRIVKDLGISLQVSVKNDHAAAPPVQRVKVSPKNIAGTGRVGPRQQARMSYSSQSEDETVHRVNTERKIPSKRQNKKYEQSPETKPNLGTSTPSSKEKEVAHGGSEVSASGASKPPLPPAFDSKTGTEMPKPKRPILKAVRQRGLRNSAKTKSSDSDKKESSDDAKERSESGDDGWEDVTTTSGTESMSEDVTPSQVDNSSCVDAVNDLNLGETKENFEADHTSKPQNNSVDAVLPPGGTDPTGEKASDIDNLCSRTIDQSAAENCENTACDSNDCSAVDTEKLSDINNLSSSTSDQSAAEMCGNAANDSNGHSAVDTEKLHESDTVPSSGENKQEELLNSVAVDIQQNETGNVKCDSNDAATALERKEVDLATPQQCNKETDISDGKMDEK